MADEPLPDVDCPLLVLTTIARSASPLEPGKIQEKPICLSFRCRGKACAWFGVEVKECLVAAFLRRREPRGIHGRPV